MRNFFRKHYEYKLSLSQYLPLYNWWFVGVVISNFLVTVGTILFLLTSYKVVVLDINNLFCGCGLLASCYAVHKHNVYSNELL